MDDPTAEEPGSVAVVSRLTDTRSNLLTIIEVGAAGGGAGALVHDLYIDLKAAGKAAVSKARQRQPDQEEREYVHQLVTEAFGGPCPPGYKLVHLNGDKTDNRWPANLAYVPESDPRPPAPLKRR
jgi:HNH endonuclease